jgi:superfamily II DNA or RNA helicase
MAFSSLFDSPLSGKSGQPRRHPLPTARVGAAVYRGQWLVGRNCDPGGVRAKREKGRGDGGRGSEGDGAMSRRAHVQRDQQDLFSIDPEEHVTELLAGRAWPDAARFPVNHAGARVRSTLWSDLVESPSPTIVAGFSSIAQLIDLLADWGRRPTAEQARVLLGTEPFATDRLQFTSPKATFTDEVRSYWLEERGISLRLSSKILEVIQALDQNRLQVRYVHGASRLHAKLYVGDAAATVGSSNFTSAGLSSQIEVNARFERRTDKRRYDEAVVVGQNLWDVGQAWDSQFRELLEALLRFVPWQEALARACADLLEGDWARQYLAGATAGAALWPSQIAGIAQALWIVDSVGSVLIADATGSGKTRMGAHLVRAVRDQLWNTGRARRDLTVLVCPPAVQATWYREAVSCGLTINTISHGLLSRASKDGQRTQELAVRDAQVLAVDESHNFLSPASNRTRQVRDSAADHVLLFTATPINRGAVDLLQLVDLLGADNFEDETLEVLERLERRSIRTAQLTPAQQERLRREIQRFTVRRTKADLNRLVDEDPESYRHPDTGRICRYPAHDMRTYATGESASDEAAATTVRAASGQLLGIALLGRQLAVPPTVAHEYSEERWLELRLNSAHGLAVHHVLGAMRSSRAALLEHIAGTTQAMAESGIVGSFKAQPTGNMLAHIEALQEEGPPLVSLSCLLPDWLTSDTAWVSACSRELDLYRQMLQAAHQLSSAREHRKAELLAKLSGQHPRLIAFDRHPITLVAIQSQIPAAAAAKVLVATGSNKRRKDVERALAATSQEATIALCSDALNEGLNLQGASAIVHLDLPTTLRVAEQRVGRVDRMDSPHDAIQAWWPDDGKAFATRANELLAARAGESAALLGANIHVPRFTGESDEVVNIQEHIAEMTRPEAETWDGIRDALDPVRRLVAGPDALITDAEYQAHRASTQRVIARVSPVHSTEPWAFFAIAGTATGAPHWILVEGKNSVPTLGLEKVTLRLRHHLEDNPSSRAFDAECDHWLSRYLEAAARLERQLLPRRMQRALEQMARLTDHWANTAHDTLDSDTEQRWRILHRLTTTSIEQQCDPHVLAERWLTLVQPVLDEARRERRRGRYVRLRHIEARLRKDPPSIAQVETTLSGLQVAAPLDSRVTACILGVPSTD